MPVMKKNCAKVVKTGVYLVFKSGTECRPQEQV